MKNAAAAAAAAVSLMPLLASVSLVGLSSLALQAAATRVGDAHHGNAETGLFYVFGPEITIVDPETGEVVNTLPGATSWGDTVYMRDHAQINHYVFANDREHQDLWVIDTDAQEVLSMVDTGDSPVHMYAIPSREEVWTHPDTNGTFDILHLGDLEYLAHSNLKVHDEIPGHGKLLWDPNLQDQGFATNTNEPYIYELDLEERTMIKPINMTLDRAPYQCASTHGIGYSYVNQHLYVECSHPEACKDTPYTDGTICSGSTWEVDVATLTPVARLVSPALSELRGDSFGAQGQVYVTPDERFVVVANKYQNYVHFLQPVDGGDTVIVDVQVDHIPGKVAFWPKDGEDVWGPDSMLEDYWAVIAQEEQVDEAGVVMIDLAQVSAAFEGGGSADDIKVVQIVVGAGSTYRPIARGSHYAMTPSGGTTGFGGYTQVAIIDLDTQVVHMLDIPEAGRVQWVPTHSDEKVADHEIRITALETAQANAAAGSDEDGESDNYDSDAAGGTVAAAGAASDSRGVSQSVETMAEAAVSLAVVGFVGAMLALWISVRNARHTKRVSEGDFKPFACI